MPRKTEREPGILILPTDAGDKAIAAFRAEFFRLTGVKYPPKTRAVWLRILTQAGFSQDYARRFLKYKGFEPLPVEDSSTLASTGEDPTFTASLMAGLRAAAGGWIRVKDAAKWTGRESWQITRLIGPGKIQDNGLSGSERRVSVASLIAYCHEQGIALNDS